MLGYTSSPRRSYMFTTATILVQPRALCTLHAGCRDCHAPGELFIGSGCRHEMMRLVGGVKLSTCIIVVTKPELDEVEIQVGVDLKRQPRVRIADREDPCASRSNDDAQEHRDV